MVLAVIAACLALMMFVFSIARFIVGTVAFAETHSYGVSY